MRFGRFEIRALTWRPSSSSSSSSSRHHPPPQGRVNNLFLLFLHLLLLFLNSNKQTQDLLSLAHVVLIHLELVKDVLDLSLGHLVSPGTEGVLEHLHVNLAVLVVGGESLDDELVGVATVSGHLALEHVHHALEGAGT